MKKRLAVIGAAVGAVLAFTAGAALAYILVTGVGGGTSAVYQEKNLLVSSQAPTLVPGDVRYADVTVTNPNDHAVSLTDISVVGNLGCGIHAQINGNPVRPAVVIAVGGSVTLDDAVRVSQHHRETKSCSYTLVVSVKGDLLGNG